MFAYYFKLKVVGQAMLWQLAKLAFKLKIFQQLDQLRRNHNQPAMFGLYPGAHDRHDREQRFTI